MGSLSERVIDSFCGRSQAELAFYSAQFADALATDLRSFPTEQAADPTGADALTAARAADDLFNALRIPIHFASSTHLQIEMWEQTLTILRNADERRYHALHKGTPFYFLGLASFVGQDFERALFYMDCALEQDHRLHGPRWYRIPSGMFVRLDDVQEAQAGRVLVNAARTLFDSYGKAVAASGGSCLSLDAYRARLVNYGTQQQPELRSVVTALLSFVLEISPRQVQLTLAPAGSGTGEPFFLHLFKGSILFETLLRSSIAGRSVVLKTPGATLHQLLSTPAVFQGLALSGPPQGLGVHTFSDVLRGVEADASTGIAFTPQEFLKSMNAEAYLAYVQQNVPGAKLIEHGPTTLSNQVAYYFVTDLTHRVLGLEVPMRQIQLQTVRNRNVYTITFRTDPGRLPESLKEFVLITVGLVLWPDPPRAGIVESVVQSPDRNAPAAALGAGLFTLLLIGLFVVGAAILRFAFVGRALSKLAALGVVAPVWLALLWLHHQVANTSTPPWMSAGAVAAWFVLISVQRSEKRTSSQRDDSDSSRRSSPDAP